MGSGTCFFGALGLLAGSGQRENQFSRTFLACFEESLFLRNQVLELLRAACRISGRLPAAEKWTCAVEVPTPWPGGGRVDIRIAPAEAGRKPLPTF